ncbi:MAG: MinD/ParA family protein [Nostocales cyanobacterium ELA608]
MTKIISLYSFRDGSGKSTIAANLAAVIAKKKGNVGIIDTNLYAPGLHHFFAIQNMNYYLNDYLMNPAISINQAVHTFNFKIDQKDFKIDIVLSSRKIGDIANIFRTELNYNRLCTGFKDLIDQKKIDYLIIDCPAGIRETTLLSMSISDAIIIVLRLDKQDIQETTMALEIAQKLEIPKKMLIMNKVINNNIDQDDLTAKVQNFFQKQATVIGLLPQSERIMEFSIPKKFQGVSSLPPSDESDISGLFYANYPEDPWSKEIEKIANKVISRIY